MGLALEHSDVRLQQLLDDVRSGADDGVELRKIVTTQAVVGDVGFVAKIPQRLDPGPEVLVVEPKRSMAGLVVLVLRRVPDEGARGLP